jgi:hypothetical protein
MEDLMQNTEDRENKASNASFENRHSRIFEL